MKVVWKGEPITKTPALDSMPFTLYIQKPLYNTKLQHPGVDITIEAETTVTHFLSFH